MARISDIKEHMEVVGADGVHVGTVDKVEPISSSPRMVRRL